MAIVYCVTLLECFLTFSTLLYVFHEKKLGNTEDIGGNWVRMKQVASASGEIELFARSMVIDANVIA